MMNDVLLYICIILSFGAGEVPNAKQTEIRTYITSAIEDPRHDAPIGSHPPHKRRSEGVLQLLVKQVKKADSR